MLDQNFSGKIEVHVFDYYSTDKTAEIVSEYVEKYPNIVKLYQNPENLGSGLASFDYHKVAIICAFLLRVYRTVVVCSILANIVS